MISTEEKIKSLLTDTLQPSHLEIHNESYKHAGHKGINQTGDSHFSVIIVSRLFEGKTLIQRHQLVYKCLQDLMDNPIHALRIKTYTEGEFNSRARVE